MKTCHELYIRSLWLCPNKSVTRLNGNHYADEIFNVIVMSEKNFILFKLQWKCVPIGPTNDKPVLVKIWLLSADQGTVHYLNQLWPKLLMDICVSQSRWVKPSDAGPGIFRENYVKIKACWWSGSWRRQAISSHDIDCVMGMFFYSFRIYANNLRRFSVDEWYEM